MHVLNKELICTYLFKVDVNQINRTKNYVTLMYEDLCIHVRLLRSCLDGVFLYKCIYLQVSQLLKRATGGEYLSFNNSV